MKTSYLAAVSRDENSLPGVYMYIQGLARTSNQNMISECNRTSDIRLSPFGRKGIVYLGIDGKYGNGGGEMKGYSPHYFKKSDTIWRKGSYFNCFIA